MLNIYTAFSYETFKGAKKHCKNICASWIDLQNAFESIRQSLIQYVLKRYHLPLMFRKLIFIYYDFLFAKVQWSSNSFHYAIGVLQGCTISPVLFISVFQMLLDVLRKSKFSPLAYTFSSNPDICRMITAYADYLEIITSIPEGNQLLLNKTDLFLTWTKAMKAKPTKCKSLACKKFDKRNKHKYNYKQTQ